MDRTNAGIFPGIGLHHKGAAAGKEGLHDPQVLRLCILLRKVVQTERHSQKDGRRQNNYQKRTNNRSFHQAAPPSFVPKRLGAV